MKKHEIQVLHVVTMLDWDGQHLNVVLVVSAMMDENYGCWRMGRMDGKNTP